MADIPISMPPEIPERLSGVNYSWCIRDNAPRMLYTETDRYLDTIDSDKITHTEYSV